LPRREIYRNFVIHFSIFDTAWGAFGFVENDRRLLATFLPRARQELVRAIRIAWPQAVEASDPLPRFRQAVVDYFEGKRTRFSSAVDLSLLPPFHQSVLETCRRIRYGHTASYADLARAVGKPNAARAVGGAMARNPLPMVIPCHRILSADGSIGGYSSTRGVNEKIRLLQLEGARVDLRSGARAVPGPKSRKDRSDGAVDQRRTLMAV